jgi:hypothetical protein
VAVLRRPASAGDDGGVVPRELRRFSPADRCWFDDEADGVPPADWPRSLADWRAIRRFRRYEAAKRAYAEALGFDVDAPFGSKPGGDWWAFLKFVGRERETPLRSPAVSPSRAVDPAPIPATERLRS